MNEINFQNDTLNFLSQNEVEKIHRSSLQILRKTGIKVANPEVREIFDKGGAIVNPGSKIVKLPADLVEESIEMAPEVVHLYGREDKYNLTIGGKKVYFGTGGSAVKILDLHSEDVRSPTLKDLKQIAQLVEKLDNINFFLRPVSPSDVPEETLDINKTYASLTYTKKHVMTTAQSPQKAVDVIELASMISEGKDNLQANPFISFVTSWMVSPLTVDSNVSGVLVKIVENGIPVALSTAPMGGSTSPITLAGGITQVHAEELSGITLCQLVNNGAPVLYGGMPLPTDPKTMAYSSGAIEAPMLAAASVQMANHLNLPTYTDAGNTDSKLPDVQSGYEKMGSLLLLALARGNYIHHAAGMLESVLTVGYGQYVIDNEMIGRVRRIMSGIDVNTEKIAGTVIDEIGPGNSFITHPHTVKFARSEEHLTPQYQVSDKKERSGWENEGSLDGRKRARKIAQSILKKTPKNFIPEEIDQAIRDRFEILA